MVDNAMNAAERHSRIIELVVQNGRVNIPDICGLFGVSEMTARRDLNELDRKGLLRRVHGGAIAQFGRSYEPSFHTRSIQNPAAKAAIGRKAADLVYDGDSIALDVGTTIMEMVPGLRGKRNLTIVTSALQIAAKVVDLVSLEVDARLILTGGIVRPRELSMIGSIPEQVYQDLHVDKAFIGIGGISLEDGLTEFNMEDTHIKRMLISSAREKIVLADGSKFGVTTFTSVASMDAIDKIVTDRSAPSQIIEKIRDLGIEVILAD